MAFFAEHFRGKRVHCPCDREHSCFVKYFRRNYGRLGLAGFTFSHEDFRSDTSQQKIDKSDIVVTNPPFTLQKEFYEAIKHKQFLVVFHNTFAKRKYILPLIATQKLWLGNGGRDNTPYKRFLFTRPDNSIAGVPYLWLQNITPLYYTAPLKTARVAPTVWHKYDDFDAYEVGRVDYINHFPHKGELMGVPISYLGAWNPDHYTIEPPYTVIPHLDGRRNFSRILIRSLIHPD